jgi:hypothetical protein
VLKALPVTGDLAQVAGGRERTPLVTLRIPPTIEDAVLRRLDLVGPTLGQSLDWTGAVFGATGEPLRTARLFGAADSMWLANGFKRYPFDVLAD